MECDKLDADMKMLKRKFSGGKSFENLKPLVVNRKRFIDHNEENIHKES